MKKIILLTALACLSLSSAALAQAPPPPPGGPNGLPPTAVLKDYLGLTDDQATAFQALLDTRQQAVQAILPQLDVAQKALDDALKGTSPDPTQLGTLLLTVQGFKEQIRAADQAASVGFKALLTAEQQAKVDQIVALQKALPALDAMQHLHLLPPPADGPGGGATRGSYPPVPAQLRSR
jgi:Spy/CpxP family protein refolding chaperone